VNHKQHSTLAVKGHGFEYVLLRRAFSRKGIRLVRASSEDDTWLEVSNDCEIPFAFYWDGECIHQESSVEKIVSKVIEMKILLYDGEKSKLLLV
jgi:iron complex transport system ATP-binding protein